MPGWRTSAARWPWSAAKAVDRHPGIPAQKYLLAHHRNDPAWRTVRPPMVALSDDAGSDLLARLADTEFDGARLAESLARAGVTPV